MKKQVKHSIIRSASILGLGAFVSKLLGAFYRVPLTNLLGSEGIGLYQMVFPVYALLLDFSGCGAPSAISKIIASAEGDKLKKAQEYLISSVKLLLVFGLAFSSIMFIFAKPFARAQGNGSAYLGYVFLSPAIFLVSILCCFRGYFQGLLNMTPTAVSQIIEQIIKLVFGALLVKLYLPNIEKAVAGATFAITLSEIFALSYLYIAYKKSVKERIFPLQIGQVSANKKENLSRYKLILKTTLPITLIGVLIPLSQVIDSFITINLLSSYRLDATALYGLLGGVALTVVNLPVSVCHGISTVAIPDVSSQETEEMQNRKAKKALFLTLLVALPCSLICLIFAPLIVKILFGSLGGSDTNVAINLLRLTSPCVLLLSIVQTTNGVLIGKGKLYFPIISLGLGVALKTVLNLVLLKIPSLNIYGGGVALIACYFLTCLINLFVILRSNIKVENAVKSAYRRQYAG